MRAEIVSVGTELLLGNIVDTNAAYLARRLSVFGVDVFHHSTVGDNLERCAETIRQALARADAVLVTGGIGPTPDDATRGAVARALGVELERRADLVARIDERYRGFGRTPTEAAYKQAEIPAGAEAIPNPTGTAPGILASRDGKTLYAMPGVPSEMLRMTEESVLPDLRRRYGLDTGLFPRVLRTRGIGESDLATQLDDLLVHGRNPTVATYVKTGEVEVRVTARAADVHAAEALIAPVEAVIRERVGQYVFGVDDEGYEQILGRLLRERGLTIATAESCTGGQIGDRITSVAGSSAYYRGGVVAYSNELKRALLGVPDELLTEHGAVSEACARAMAEGAAERLGADLALAATGIAGPDGGTPGKPVGLVYIAVCDHRAGETAAMEARFRGDRAMVKERTALAALELACRRLAGSIR
ncbi:MAG: competence/damage-inducible protein A [Armatimonadetes bacterium]|nr:competence/damage-inducible protein A [Armatimonadota bacterium]